MVTVFGTQFPVAYNSSRERLPVTLRHQCFILFFALLIPTIEETRLPLPYSSHPHENIFFFFLRQTQFCSLLEQGKALF